MTIAELKLQKRWVLWKLEPIGDKFTKVPYQPNGRKAQSNNPVTWNTYEVCDAVQSQFSGIGCVLGEVDGVSVWGVDIDKCCDAVTGKFTPESRETVIGLNSYGEYSPSGTGCHVFGLGKMPGNGKPIVRPMPGCKQIEIKGAGYYFTFSERHLSKTPKELMSRQEQLNALCEQVSVITKTHLTVSAPNEEERFQKLWAGDTSDYGGDASRADMAFFDILMRRYHNDVFKVRDEAFKSKLYREKWERTDYLSRTILKVAANEQIFNDTEELMDEDGPTEYLTDALSDAHEGWCPLGEVSLIGAPSGTGKTYFALTMLEKVRKGEDVWGHKSTPREYRSLLHDRSKKAMGRTIRHMRLPPAMVDRIIRLSPAQQAMSPADALEALILQNPGVQVWFIEGLDLWSPNMLKMEVIAPMIDALQRVATRHNVCVLATVGAPKMKAGDHYFGRDALFGSSALARKVETVILISLSNREDADSPRQYDVMTRNGRTEKIYMRWEPSQGLVVTEKPVEKETVPPAIGKMHLNCMHKFKPGDQVIYSPELGSEGTFNRWRLEAVKQGIVVRNAGTYFMTPKKVETKPN